MKFCMHLMHKGLISATQLYEALAHQDETRIPLGRLAIELTKLTEKESLAILRLQPQLQKPFGRIAIDLGFLSDGDLADLLFAQIERTKSVEEILIERGAISAVVLTAEKIEFYEGQHSRIDNP